MEIEILQAAQEVVEKVPKTLVNIGVDLGKMNTVGDLQGGIEEAERLLGYKVVPLHEAPSPA